MHTIAAVTIGSFIVTAAIVVYKGLIPVVGRMLHCLYVDFIPFLMNFPNICHSACELVALSYTNGYKIRYSRLHFSNSISSPHIIQCIHHIVPSTLKRLENPRSAAESAVFPFTCTSQHAACALATRTNARFIVGSSFTLFSFPGLFLPFPFLVLFDKFNRMIVTF